MLILPTGSSEPVCFITRAKAIIQSSNMKHQNLMKLTASYADLCLLHASVQNV